MPPGPGVEGKKKPSWPCNWSVSAPASPWNQMFQAAGDNKPGFKFDDIDIISSRKSLRNLLLFCSANNSPSFRLNLQLAHNTLLIESYNPRPFADIGFGRVFEDTCKSYPAEWEEGLSASVRGSAFSRGCRGCWETCPPGKHTGMYVGEKAVLGFNSVIHNNINPDSMEGVHVALFIQYAPKRTPVFRLPSPQPSAPADWNPNLGILRSQFPAC